MAMNAGTPAIGGGGRRRRGHKRGVMAEINVTPMVDVMLVLLIIFMVSAPLLTVGVPVDLPQSQAKSLDQDKEPLAVSVNAKGQVYLQNSEIQIEDLVPKLEAVAQARGGKEARVYVRGDKNVDYGTMMRVMGRLSGAGFHRVALVTEFEQGAATK
jgi:biopolymer transport protein TolR